MQNLSRALLLFAFTASASALAAGEKATKHVPAVPGFARFHQAKPDADGGRLLFSSLNCAACHATGTAATTKPAPVLDGVGMRVKRSYLKQFLNDPHATKPGTTMPNLFADDPDKQAKIDALVQYLASTGSPPQAKPIGKSIAAGQDLYAKVGCVACHGTRDSKGDEAKLFPTSVPLGNLKAKYTLASLKTFLENPHVVRPSGHMPAIVVGKEAVDVANYLMQGTVAGFSGANMKYSYYEGDYQKLPDFDKLKPVKTGITSDFDLGVARRNNDWAIKFEGYLKVENAGNYTFHTNSDDGSKLWIGDKLVVNNDGIHPPQAKSSKIKLAKGTHKVIVGFFQGGGGFELTVDFEGPGLGRQLLGPHIMLTEKPEPVAKGNKDPENSPLEPAMIAKGKELFASVGCANCHAMGKETKRLEAQALAKLKADAGCLQATPKKGVPWFGLSPAQKSALAALIKTPWTDKLAPKDSIAFTMKAFNCYACHERGEVGGVEEALNPHFTATFKEWGDEVRIPPSLNGVGAKMKPGYLKKIFEEGSHDRPYMNTRMPKFGANVMHLINDFAKADPDLTAPKVTFTDPATKIKSIGRSMVGRQKQGTFLCVNCHNFGGVKTEGVQGIDMAIMTDRLKHDWFVNYLIEPSKFRPGTRMPSSFPDGVSQLKGVLGGKADAQIEAIWMYLSDGKGAILPAGMNKQSIPLIPTTEAIIYRNFIQGAGPRAIGVGFPERAHVAFDANEMRLAMIWQGLFIDARRHWTDRGVGFEPPMGDNIMHLPTGVSFYVLSQPDEPWPTKSAKDLSYKFLGYNVTDDQRPTFRYKFHDITIEDTPNAVETKLNPAIRRTITLKTENPIDKLYYRAAVADKIEAEKNGWYRIGDWRMRIESDAQPIIRQAGNKKELLVPIRFKDNSAKLVQEYVW
ncbi:MAG TPA: c-type cytochrome [Gemmataceae bacterium]|nr:c-type cytochrome [Gemmataceae bacterium]